MINALIAGVLEFIIDALRAMYKAYTVRLLSEKKADELTTALVNSKTGEEQQNATKALVDDIRD